MSATTTTDMLLVPMRLDAMQMNAQFAPATTFFRFQMDYALLATFASPEPAPFNSNNYTPPPTGIHLHWTLPEGLRQGTRSSDDTAFPLLPNRWVVTRQQSNPSGAAIVKAWVIESDTEVTDQSGSPYYNGSKPIQIGKVTVCSATMGPLTEQSAPFLKAVSPGSATFAAYAPGVQNVLSFVDDVTDSSGAPIAAAAFTYTVMGWYSDPASDPLGDAQYAWAANSDVKGSWVLQKATATAPQTLFDWYVFAPSAADLPRQMLLTAQVSGVVWNASQDYVPPANYPTDIPGNVRVAVGNTSIEALAALTVAKGATPAEAQLLEAFQYGEMAAFDQPGSAAVLNSAIRKHWFGASPGGTRWTVVAVGGNGMTPDTPTTPAPLTPAQQTALAAYNTTQAQLDRQQRLLESLQWELYGLWWKYNRAQPGSLPIPTIQNWTLDQFRAQLKSHLGLDPDYPPSACTSGSNSQLLFCQVIAQQTLVTQLLKQSQQNASALKALLNLKTQAIKGVQLPVFNSANDPVIVVSGLGRSTNFDPVGSLLCRLPEQTLSSLAVNGTTYSNKGSGTDISASLPTLDLPAGILPVPVAVLLTESFFLSPWMFAADVLKDTEPCPIGPPPSNSPAAAVANAIAAASPTDAANWTPGSATTFGPIASSAMTWVQPWVPLLLDWEITVIEDPCYTAGQTNDQMYTFSTENWSFNGTDFAWAGTHDTNSPNFDVTDAQKIISGRTFVTPHLSNNLASQIDTFVTNHQERNPDIIAELGDLETKLKAIASQDLLSQRLSGFLAAMAERSHTGVAAPDADMKKLVGNLQHGHPAPWPEEKGNEVGAPFDFAPMCGTFFVFNKLQVTDSFGRAIDLMLANGNTLGVSSPNTEQESFYPIVSAAMQPTGFTQGTGISTNATQRMVQLAPRMVQDSRLTLTLLSNDGLDTDIYQTAGANPVCGWLVANHLDRSIAAYAADGIALGELYLAQGAGTTYTAEWQPDPTNPTAPQTIAAIPNTFLSGALQSLVTETLKDNGVSFDGFLKSIDATLWTIDPLGQRKDQDLSVLVGRPLAVVRAQAMLNYRGLAYTMQDWDTTFAGPGGPDIVPIAAQTGGVFDQKWPVLLGSQALRNDGLIGYFLDSAETVNWSVFNAVNIPADATATTYLQSITPTTCPQLAFTDDSMTPTVAAGQLAKLTMLMDPRGSVHAFTGLLPVASLDLPSQFVTQPLKTLSYIFRVGPFLTSPNAVRLPRPAERKGTWTWFDETIATTVPIQQSDSKARMTTIPPLIKEGWLKLTPNPPNSSPKK
jgi:hypothetical protein